MIQRKNNSSVAVIGEGETEWFYVDAIRVLMHYSFTVVPDFPKHIDIAHIQKMVCKCLNKGFDYVVCLVDMGHLIENSKEMAKYRTMQREFSKKKYNDKVVFIESKPCTEFWFLLHFLPQPQHKKYSSRNEVIEELKKYLPGYEKEKRYFIKSLFKQVMTEQTNIEKAISNAEQLLSSVDLNDAERCAYSQIHKLFHLLKAKEPMTK